MPWTVHFAWVKTDYRQLLSRTDEENGKSEECR